MLVLTHACSKQSATFGEEGFFQAIFRAVHYRVVALQIHNKLVRGGAEMLAKVQPSMAHSQYLQHAADLVCQQLRYSLKWQAVATALSAPA